MTPQEFCSFHVPALERNEVRHNVMLAEELPTQGSVEPTERDLRRSSRAVS